MNARLVIPVLAVGTRSQLSKVMQAAARTGMTRRAFIVPP